MHCFTINDLISARPGLIRGCGMTVRFFAYFRDKDYAGCKEMEWPFKPADLYDLCHQIADTFGEKFRNEILSADGENIGERSIIMVNGRRAEFIGGIRAKLKDSDTVLIFPVVAGG